MAFARTILAILTALSVAMLPMAGAFAVPQDEVTASEVVVASAHDCCDGEGMPVGHVMKECQASAGCAAKCFNFYAAVLSRATLRPPIGGTESPFVSNPFCSQTASPPFRPPRV